MEGSKEFPFIYVALLIELSLNDWKYSFSDKKREGGWWKEIHSICSNIRKNFLRIYVGYQR